MHKLALLVIASCHCRAAAAPLFEIRASTPFDAGRQHGAFVSLVSTDAAAPE